VAHVVDIWALIIWFRVWYLVSAYGEIFV